MFSHTDDGNLNIIETESSAMGVFVVSNIDKMREVIDDYCERTSSHFVVQKKSKNFGLPSKLFCLCCNVLYTFFLSGTLKSRRG